MTWYHRPKSMPDDHKAPLAALQVPQLVKTPIFRRVILFILAFVVISGLSGSWLISTNKLLFPFHFGIYGSAGKSLLFGIVVFFLLTKSRVLAIPVPKWTKLNWLLLGLAVFLLGVFFGLANQLLQFQRASDAPVLTGLTHLALLGSGAAVTAGIFGVRYLLEIWRRCRNEVLATLTLSTIFYFLFGTIFQLWPYLSKIVLWAVLGLLQFSHPNAIVVPPLTIQLPQFAITIGEYCSGIESLFLITTLYLLIGCLEWNKLHRTRFFLHYFPLIIGMFALNIVRVYLIIQAGVIFGPQIAAKLFHTYLGMILFMSYFLLYWKWSAPMVLQRTATAGKENI